MSSKILSRASAYALAAIAGPALSAASAFAAPKPETGWHPPRDVSLDGHRIDWLLNVTNLFIFILFVVMVIWMFWAIFAHGEKHEADYDHGDSRHTVVTAGIISAVIFFVVDGNLWWNSTKDVGEAFWNFQAAQANKDHIKIEVNARQWLWQGRYAGPDGKFNTDDDQLVTNDFVVPKGVPVVLQLASPDVIHNFYLPNFRVKQDAMPGTVNQFWFQAQEEGEFEIGCAQHCGANHYKMRGVLHVVPREQFETWSNEASVDSKQLYDPEDKEAHWGWDWKKI